MGRIWNMFPYLVKCALQIWLEILRWCSDPRLSVWSHRSSYNEGRVVWVRQEEKNARWEKKLGEGRQCYSAASVGKGRNWKSHSVRDEEIRNLLVKSLPSEQAREPVFNPQKTHYNQQGKKAKAAQHSTGESETDAWGLLASQSSLNRKF